MKKILLGLLGTTAWIKMDQSGQKYDQISVLKTKSNNNPQDSYGGGEDWCVCMPVGGSLCVCVFVGVVGSWGGGGVWLVVSVCVGGGVCVCMGGVCVSGGGVVCVSGVGECVRLYIWGGCMSMGGGLCVYLWLCVCMHLGGREFVWVGRWG